MLVRRPITNSFLIFCVGSLGLAQPGARIDEILDVGLDLPPGRDLNLIGRLEESLGAAHGRIDGGIVELQVPVVGGDAVADPRDAHAKAERVVVAARAAGRAASNPPLTLKATRLRSCSVVNIGRAKNEMKRLVFSFESQITLSMTP